MEKTTIQFKADLAGMFRPHGKVSPASMIFRVNGSYNRITYCQFHEYNIYRPLNNAKLLPLSTDGGMVHGDEGDHSKLFEEVFKCWLNSNNISTDSSVSFSITFTYNNKREYPRNSNYRAVTYDFKMNEPISIELHGKVVLFVDNVEIKAVPVNSAGVPITEELIYCVYNEYSKIISSAENKQREARREAKRSIPRQIMPPGPVTIGTTQVQRAGLSVSGVQVNMRPSGQPPSHVHALKRRSGIIYPDLLEHIKINTICFVIEPFGELISMSGEITRVFTLHTIIDDFHHRRKHEICNPNQQTVVDIFMRQRKDSDLSSILNMGGYRFVKTWVRKGEGDKFVGVITFFEEEKISAVDKVWRTARFEFKMGDQLYAGAVSINFFDYGVPVVEFFNNADGPARIVRAYYKLWNRLMRRK